MKTYDLCTTHAEMLEAFLKGEIEVVKDEEKFEATGPEPPNLIYDTHTRHCCPVHGCKYGSAVCTVVTGGSPPVYVFNNGCDQCEADRVEYDRKQNEAWAKAAEPTPLDLDNRYLDS